MKAFKIAKDPKYDGYQRALSPMIYKLFDKKSAGSGVATLAKKSVVNTVPNYQLANEFHRQIIRKFNGRKVYSSFKDNIWGVDIANIQSLSKHNRVIKYLLCAMVLVSKYAWVSFLKEERGVTIVYAFENF